MFLGADLQAELLAAVDLPVDFMAEVEGLWAPLADRIAARRRERGGTLVVGVCGPQGSGKSTGAQALRVLLEHAGLRVAVLSLDDLYLTRRSREILSVMVNNRLFLTRGVPGTHDAVMGREVLDALARPGRVALPRFDKAADEPLPEAEWPVVEGPVDVVLFEGWCVGARPQPEADLDGPVNALELAEDLQGRWRLYANERLAGSYRRLFKPIRFLVQLRAPSFDTVYGWRLEQEEKLIARTGQGMDPNELHRFIQHYERLTRWIDEEMPGRADVVVQLDAARKVVDVKAGGGGPLPGYAGTPPRLA